VSREHSYPDDWETNLLDKVTKRGSGHTPSQKHPEYWNGGIKWVSLADSSELDNRYIHNTTKEISPLGIKKSSAVLHPKDTVILSRDAGVGKSAILGQETAISQHFIAWDCEISNKKLHHEFLYYLLQLMKPEFERMAVGSTIKTIGLPYFKKLKISYPKLNEQTTIANLLSTWDLAIDKTEQLVAAKEKQKKSLMQSLLTGKQRIKGFQKPWVEYQLGGLFNERAERANDHLTLVSITREKGIIPRNEDRKDTSNEDKSKYLRICKGDIGYNTMRMWQGVSALSSLEGIVSPAYTICTPKKIVDGEFMAYLFKLPRIVNLFYRHSQGLTSDTWNLKYKHLKVIKVKVPDKEEQKAIARVLNVCDEELGLIKKGLAGLQKQKRGLMQKLLTGEWRVRLG